MLLCFGTSNNDVNINDLRIKGEQITKLKEHTDVVRAVKLIDEGRACISAGSDGLLKLWDVGMRQCIKSYNFHTDSIWCLKYWKSKSTVFTGGKDGVILMTDLIKDVEHKIIKEPQPIRSLAIDKKYCSLWYCTSDSAKYLNIVKYERYNKQIPAESKAEYILTNGGSIETKSKASASHTINSLNTVVKFKILSNKKFVLTQNSNGNLHVWNIKTGQCVRKFDKQNFESLYKDLNSLDPDVNQDWCSVNISMGFPCIEIKEGFSTHSRKDVNLSDEIAKYNIINKPDIKYSSDMGISFK